MTKKRWLLITIVIAFVSTALESIMHPVFLGKAYEATASVWRPMADINKLMPYGFVSSLIVAYLLVFIYHKGYEGKRAGLAEGLRFGFIIGLFTSIPMSVWTYVMFPITKSIAIGWFFIGMIDMMIIGTIIGLLYKRN